MKVLEARELLDIVRVQAQVRKLLQIVQPLDVLDKVEAKVEPLQVDQVVHILNFCNNVIV